MFSRGAGYLQELYTRAHNAQSQAGTFAFVAIPLTFWLAWRITTYYLAYDAIPCYNVAPPVISSLSSDEAVQDSSVIHCHAPATGQYLGHVNASTTSDIDEKIELAQAAQEEWRTTTFKQRKRVLQTILNFVLANKQELSRIACLDSGKTMIDASLGEILVTVEKLKWTIDHGEKALRPSKRPTNLLMMYKSNEVRYEPLGVVAALVSWNYPFHNLIGPMISAIFAGNAIVVKASENTAWSASYFTKIVQHALKVCRYNQNLVQHIVCWPNVAGHLSSHPSISHITFIGSKQIAHKVAASAATALTPCVMELGGKDAAIVLDSALPDLPRITEILLRGTFQASGQNCIGIERIIATPAIHDQLVSALSPRIAALRVGSDLDSSPSEHIDMGAMISSNLFDHLEDLIASAVQAGAKLHCGGKRLTHPKFTKGHYFQPTLLTNVTTDMEVANLECFAPICVVYAAKDYKDAIKIANSPDFGLGASVFGAVPSLFHISRSARQTMEVVEAMKTGMVAINDFAAYYAVQLPFGGVGGSGYGRFAGEEGLRGLCNLKSVCVDRFGWAGVGTAIPPPVRYPVKDTRKGFAFTSAVIELGYAGLWGKVLGLASLLKNSMG